MKDPSFMIRQRAEIIMKVRCGLMTATQAARKLGVSRKTYYKWEQRGLKALLGGLADKEPGRRSSAIDPDKQAMGERTSHPTVGAQGGPQRFEAPWQRQTGPKKISASRRRWP